MSLNMLTTEQAARIISKRTGRFISIRQVCHEIKIGYLIATKIGQTYLISPDDLKNYRRRNVGRPTNDQVISRKKLLEKNQKLLKENKSSSKL